MPFKKGEIPQGAKPFQKGESGNPNGYPKGIPNRSTIARYVAGLPAKSLGELAEYIPNDCDIATAGMFKLAHKLIFEGDVIAGRELYDSAYGKNADLRVDQGAERQLVMIITPCDIEDIAQEPAQESV